MNVKWGCKQRGGNNPQPARYRVNQDSRNSDLPAQVGLKPVTPVQAKKRVVLHSPLSCGLPFPRTGIFPAGMALAEAGQLSARLLMSDVGTALTWGQRHRGGPHGRAGRAGGDPSPRQDTSAAVLGGCCAPNPHGCGRTSLILPVKPVVTGQHVRKEEMKHVGTET